MTFPILPPSQQPPPQSPPPQSPPPGDQSTRRSSASGLLLALAAFAGAALILGGLWFFVVSGGEVVRGDGPVSSAGTESEATSSESAETPDRLIDHVQCPAGTLSEVCEAAAFVESVRGRPFKEFPTVELVSDQQFVERLLRDFDEVREDLDVTTQVWRSLNFIGPDDDLFESLSTSYEVGVVGVYFSETQELYIQREDLDLYAEMVIVHELVHAFDDQWFDLHRPEYEDEDGELGYGFSAIVEGNASRVETAWRELLSSDEQDELARLERAALSPDEIEIYLDLPTMLLQLQVSPYRDGEVLVAEIAASGGEAAVDAALESPPPTSEQVLHPDAYAEAEAAVVIPRPPTPSAGATVIDEGSVGELVFDLWLGDDVGTGWGGDRYVAWETLDTACTRIDVVGDTSEDTVEFEVALRSWADGSQGRSVSVETVEAPLGLVTVVRVTGCY